MQKEALKNDLSWWENSNFLNDYYLRRAFVEQFGLLGFLLVYLPHYVQMAPAEFHPELINYLENPLERFLLVVGFRGSAKSTFGSLALPVYTALEKSDIYPFIIPLADTSMQAGINIANIQFELEYNQLIKQDYGTFNFEKAKDKSPEPTLESDEEWQSKNILLSNGVRILARSRGQKVRGLRHRQHRPKLVIVDDPEDLEWVRKKENRDKTERWIKGEVIPAMDETTGKLVVIGNWLHTDALLARLKKTKIFTILEYPLVNQSGKCTWPAKYPTQESLDSQRDKVGPVAWQREYMLKTVAEEGQEITEKDIHYYDEESKEADMGLSGTGVDLAISKKDTADYTAMVSGKSAFIEGKPQIFIQPMPVNARLDFYETKEQAKAINVIYQGAHQFFVEDVQYQKAAIQEFERELLSVIPMKPINDKRARLRVAATYIKNGTVVFPRTGCEDLLIQLLGFGVEEHDDLCFVAGTKIATPWGDKNIEDLKFGDKVITPFGIRKVLYAGQTGEDEVMTVDGLTGTKNHPIYTSRGFLGLDTFVYLKYNKDISDFNLYHLILWRYKKLLYLMESNIVCWGKEGIISVGQQPIKEEEIRKDFMSRFGNFIIKRKFRRAGMFIIKMAILLTTTFLIWNLYRLMNIVKFRNIIIKKQWKNIWKKLDQWQLNGTNQRPEKSGIENMQKKYGRIQNDIKRFVKDAANHFWPFMLIPNVARGIVLQINTEDCTLKKLEPFSSDAIGREKVYNLLIEKDNVYYANGILVGNCDALVYLILGLVNQGLKNPEIIQIL